MTVSLAAQCRRLSSAYLPVCGLLLGLAAAPARAQSLFDLLLEARQHEPVFLSALAQAESVPFRADQVLALRRPNVDLSTSASFGKVSLPVELLADNNRSATNTNVTLVLRYSLFNRTNDASIAQARRLLPQAEQDVSLAEQDLMLRVAQAYFDVLGAEQALAATRGNQAAITEQLGAATVSFRVGRSTITDVREAQSRYDLSVSQAVSADSDLRAKRVALEQLVGRKGLAPVAVAVPLELPDLQPASVDDWLNRALAEHPAILRARISVELAELETQKAQAARMPTLEAVMNLNTAHASGGLALINGTAGTTSSGTLGLQATVPLYNGGATQSRIKETLALETKARRDLDAARDSVTKATTTAFLSLEAATAQVQALRTAELSSQSVLEATQRGYSIGLRVNLDVLNAQSQRYINQRDLVLARHAVLLGRLRLAQSAGVARLEDVATMSQWIKGNGVGQTSAETADGSVAAPQPLQLKLTPRP